MAKASCDLTYVAHVMNPAHFRAWQARKFVQLADIILDTEVASSFLYAGLIRYDTSQSTSLKA